MRTIDKLNIGDDIVHLDVSKVEFNRAITKPQ